MYPHDNIPLGLCQCGCGLPTKLATVTNKKHGRIKGVPQYFLKGHRVPTPLIERFWSRIDKHGPIPEHSPELGPCWIYIGHRNTGGYGHINTGRHHGSMVLTHRYSWILHYGPIQDETPFVLHHCDNPPCVNPAHLFVGTQADNVKDMMAKGHGSNIPRRYR